ncbi:MAG: Dabb family protein [Bacilli bacterium]|nr:Dabb family protein [Acholeplasmataceae bacterium]MDY2902672.1 Dabb family protein [Bacilli bacterium]
MIKHIVCYKLKDSSIESRNKTKEVLLSMQGKVKHFNTISVGIDCLGSERSYDIVLEMTFNSFNDMTLYQQDSYHVEVVKKYMHAARLTSVSVDYEF